MKLQLPQRLTPYLLMDTETGEVVARLHAASIEAIRQVIREELEQARLLLVSPEQLEQGMRRLVGCLMHGDGEKCEVCQ
jgi:hypothetical protein